VAALVLWMLAWPFAGAVEQPALLLPALALTGVIFAVLGVLTGVWADTFDQHAFIANLVISPLALLGGVFYAADRLRQPWHTLTQADPLYYLVDATRHGWAGVHEASVAAALLVALVVAAAVFSLAVALVERGWRLKP
jgi:ABC-2 type transport system permease protein